jgi:hypothetical protein
MVWALVGLSVVELFVVHLLIALLWNPVAAFVLSLFAAAMTVWLVLFIRSFARNPVTVDAERVVMRVGFLRRVDVPLSSVAAVRSSFSAEQLKAPGVLNLALLAYPNILLELGEPVPLGRRRRPIRAIAHCLDDPDSFREALGR